MPVLGVLHGELVEPELLLHRLELGGDAILERDPDETVGPADVAADLRDRDIGDPLPSWYATQLTSIGVSARGASPPRS